MKQPTTNEQMLRSVLRVVTKRNGQPVGRGTAFAYACPTSADRQIAMLITNKHVIADATEIDVTFHCEDGSSRLLTLSWTTDRVGMIEHPVADLVGINVGVLLDKAVGDGRPIDFQHLNDEIIPADEDWEWFDAIEQVTMIGCPNGLYDAVNNLPIARRGITATSLAMRYEGRDEFMVDIACFPGSSGSPVFIHDTTGYFDRKKNTHQLAGARLYLVGVLSSGPVMNSRGQVVMATTGEAFTPTMLHLGYCIRASAVREIGAIAKANFLAARSDAA